MKFVQSNDLDGVREGDHARRPRRSTPSRSATRSSTSPTSRGSPASPTTHGIPLVLDNTVSPYLLRPIDHGADIVVYSATKFIGGHGTSLGGLIVDSGKFDWTNGKFPLIAGPDPSYHGLDFVEALKPHGQHRLHHQGARDAAARPRARRCRPSTPSCSCRGSRRCTCGCRGTPRTRWRWRSSSRSTRAVAWVNYPGLPSSPEQRARREVPAARARARSSASASRAGSRPGKKFIDSLKLISHLANIGDAKTPGDPPGDARRTSSSRPRSSWRPA